MKDLKSQEKKKILLIGIILMLVLGTYLVAAHENFNETKKLIDSNISCDKLNDEQLNEMGDYYMEQMHPGEAHEMMHRMMGGEDSELTREMHINMAKSIYCGENSGMGGMMGSGNMMMGNYKDYYSWNIYSILSLILFISLIILVILIIIKLLQDLSKGNKK